MNPLAQELNDLLAQHSPHVLEMLSDLGKNLFFPDEAFAGRDWSVDDSLQLLDAMNAVDKVVVEVGSALNGHRRKFVALLGDPSVHRIVVEQRARFCRLVRNTSRPRWPHRAESWWSWTPLGSMTTWCGT